MTDRGGLIIYQTLRRGKAKPKNYPNVTKIHTP